MKKYLLLVVVGVMFAGLFQSCDKNEGVNEELYNINASDKDEEPDRDS